jgi:hypothetical protein
MDWVPSERAAGDTYNQSRHATSRRAATWSHCARSMGPRVPRRLCWKCALALADTTARSAGRVERIALYRRARLRPSAAQERARAQAQARAGDRRTRRGQGERVHDWTADSTDPLYGHTGLHRQPRAAGQPARASGGSSAHLQQSASPSSARALCPYAGGCGEGKGALSKWTLCRAGRRRRDLGRLRLCAARPCRARRTARLATPPDTPREGVGHAGAAGLRRDRRGGGRSGPAGRRAPADSGPAGRGSRKTTGWRCQTRGMRGSGGEEGMRAEG